MIFFFFYLLGHLRLTDFGLSRRLTPRLRRVRSFSGSNIYVAPEVLSDNTQVGHGKTVDWWGYGVLLHLLVTQQAPFWSDNNDELFAMIKEGDPPDFTQYPYLDQDTVSLLSQLLIRDPTQVCKKKKKSVWVILTLIKVQLEHKMLRIIHFLLVLIGLLLPHVVFHLRLFHLQIMR